MSGHSKWHSIKHKKAITDAKKANIFTKLAKDISVAAQSGADPEMNFRLRMAIDKAKSFNMPKDNIERAIKKGSGLLKEGDQIDELVYEAYGPGQIALLIKVATDNKNRTLGEIKNLLQKNGGKFVEGGSVMWQFEQVGKLLAVPKEDLDKEDIEMKIIESNALDYSEEDGKYSIFTQPQELRKVKDALQIFFDLEEIDLIFRAKNEVKIDGKAQAAYERLLDALDEQEDVSAVYDNLG
jgi:YebC/PmpR family DNA-binding regulatory protein